MSFGERDMTAVFLSVNAKTHNSMNEFEKKFNALRIQYRDERVQITKDCALAIGHLNTAIGAVKSPEAREALRAEKARIYEATRNSIKYSRLCYRQQLDALEDELRTHYEKHPSRRQIRHALRALLRSTQDTGDQTVTLSLGKGVRCTVTFTGQLTPDNIKQ